MLSLPTQRRRKHSRSVWRCASGDGSRFRYGERRSHNLGGCVPPLYTAVRCLTRTSHQVDGDIEPYWASIASIIDTASFIAPQSDFYGHNDMDMLQVGNTVNGGNLTVEEARSHFTAWALLKSPLLIGTDVRPPLTAHLYALTMLMYAAENDWERLPRHTAEQGDHCYQSRPSCRRVYHLCLIYSALMS